MPEPLKPCLSNCTETCTQLVAKNKPDFGAHAGDHLLCKLATQLQTLYRFLRFLFVYNKLGHLLFAQRLTPMSKTDGVLAQF